MLKGDIYLYTLPIEVSDFFDHLIEAVSTIDRPFVTEELLWDIRQAINSKTKITRIRIYVDWTNRYNFIDEEEFMFLLEGLGTQLQTLSRYNDDVLQILGNIEKLNIKILPGHRHFIVSEVPDK